MFAEPTTLDLNRSSAPSGAPPTFEPIATGRARSSDEALHALADEITDLAAREKAAFQELGGLQTTDPRYTAAGNAAKALSVAVFNQLAINSVILGTALDKA